MKEKIQFGNITEHAKAKIEKFLQEHKRFLDADDTDAPEDIFPQKKGKNEWGKILNKDAYDDYKKTASEIKEKIEDLKNKAIIANNNEDEPIENEIELLEKKLQRLKRFMEEMEKEYSAITKEDPGLEALREKLKGQNATLN